MIAYSTDGLIEVIAHTGTHIVWRWRGEKRQHKSRLYLGKAGVYMFCDRLKYYLDEFRRCDGVFIA